LYGYLWCRHADLSVMPVGRPGFARSNFLVLKQPAGRREELVLGLRRRRAPGMWASSMGMVFSPGVRKRIC